VRKQLSNKLKEIVKRSPLIKGAFVYLSKLKKNNMKIEFIKDCYINIYSETDDTDIPIEKKMTKGEIYETKHIIPIFKDISEVKFEDDMLSFIDVDLFEIIEE
jgi:hypothetical protein